MGRSGYAVETKGGPRAGILALWLFVVQDLEKMANLKVGGGIVVVVVVVGAVMVFAVGFATSKAWTVARRVFF